MTLLKGSSSVRTVALISDSILQMPPGALKTLTSRVLSKRVQFSFSEENGLPFASVDGGGTLFSVVRKLLVQINRMDTQYGHFYFDTKP